MTSSARQLFAVLAMICTASAVGCSSPEQDLCEQKVACEDALGDPNTEVDVCLVQADADAQIASLRGCEDLYNQAIDCFADNGTCVSGQFRGGDSCAGLFDSVNFCVREARTLDFDN